MNIIIPARYAPFLKGIIARAHEAIVRDEEYRRSDDAVIVGLAPVPDNEIDQDRCGVIQLQTTQIGSMNDLPDHLIAFMHTPR